MNLMERFSFTTLHLGVLRRNIFKPQGNAAVNVLLYSGGKICQGVLRYRFLQLKRLWHGGNEDGHAVSLSLLMHRVNWFWMFRLLRFVTWILVHIMGNPVMQVWLYAIAKRHLRHYYSSCVWTNEFRHGFFLRNIYSADPKFPLILTVA